MQEADRGVDWSVVTWEGNRRAQLARALSLTVRERLEAVEELCRLAELFRKSKRYINPSNCSNDS